MSNPNSAQNQKDTADGISGELLIRQAAQANENAMINQAAHASPSKKRARRELPVSIWYEACQKFMQNPEKYNNSQLKFLRSEESGVLLDESNKMSFSKRLRSFKNGNLPQESSVKRVRKGKYHDIEQCLIAYMETRTKFAKGKTAVTWPFLIELSKRFATALGYKKEEFRASPGWLSNVFRRNKKAIDDDVNDGDVMVYLDSIKKYCRKKEFGEQIEKQCEQLSRLIQTQLKGDGSKSKKEAPQNAGKASREPNLGSAEDQGMRQEIPRFSSQPSVYNSNWAQDGAI
jgi:hypothetical protein